MANLGGRVGFLPSAGVVPAAGGVGLAGAGSAKVSAWVRLRIGCGRRRRWCGEASLCARHHVVPDTLLGVACLLVWDAGVESRPGRPGRPAVRAGRRAGRGGPRQPGRGPGRRGGRGRQVPAGERVRRAVPRRGRPGADPAAAWSSARTACRSPRSPPCCASWSGTWAPTASPSCCPAARPGSWPGCCRSSASPPRPGDAGEARARLFEQVLMLLEQLAEAGPVVLVIEDAHWADRSTRDLLAFLIRNQQALDGLLIVVTYRSDELHRTHPLRPLLAELDRVGWVPRMELRPAVPAGHRRAGRPDPRPRARMRTCSTRCTGAPRATRCSSRRCSARASWAPGCPSRCATCWWRRAAAARGDPGRGPGRQRGRRADRPRAAGRGHRAGRRRAGPGAAARGGRQRAADRRGRLRVPARADPRGDARGTAARRAAASCTAGSPRPSPPTRRWCRRAGPRSSRRTTGTRPTTRPGRWSAPGRRPAGPATRWPTPSSSPCCPGCWSCGTRCPDADAAHRRQTTLAVLEDGRPGRRTGRGVRPRGHAGQGRAAGDRHRRRAGPGRAAAARPAAT